MSALYRLRRHPLAVRAHFTRSLVLTYALPPHILEPMLPPGLALDIFNGYGFLAIALVETKRLRPAFLPEALGCDFFLSGYRIFTRLARPTSAVRGLYVLRSDTDRRLMLAGGTLFTHYGYHLCKARLGESSWSVRAPHQEADLDITLKEGPAALPPESPFHTEKDALRFAGPLPFTFSYEPETASLIRIRGVREQWCPQLATVEVQRASFFDGPQFHGVPPRLAAAFQVHDIPYRWERGVRVRVEAA